MKEIRNILIRNLSDEDMEAVNFAIRETGKKQASQALLVMLRSYQRMTLQLRRMAEENQRLVQENSRLKLGLESIRQTSNALVTNK